MTTTLRIDRAGQPALNIDDSEAAVLRSLVACEVRFLIIGGRAVQFHGENDPFYIESLYAQP